MIIQTIKILFNIHTPETQGGIADMVVAQHELHYLKDHMGDCVGEAIYQYSDGSILYNQIRHPRSLHFEVSSIPTYEDAQVIEKMLKDIAKSLISEIGATE